MCNCNFSNVSQSLIIIVAVVFTVIVFVIGFVYSRHLCKLHRRLTERVCLFIRSLLRSRRQPLCRLNCNWSGSRRVDAPKGMPRNVSEIFYLHLSVLPQIWPINIYKALNILGRSQNVCLACFFTPDNRVVFSRCNEISIQAADNATLGLSTVSMYYSHLRSSQCCSGQKTD